MHATRALITLSLPSLPEPLVGPRFSTYSPEEVSWLLTDLSGAELEMPVARREECIRAGAHYAESLPVEYRPSVDYLSLFQVLLASSARQVAYLVGVLTETVLAARRSDVVLASLARAGTPVGILMRRWGQQIHHLSLPHYTMSVVRGRGADLVALRYLARHHDPARVIFVDGWTGKGTITRELRHALAHAATEELRFPAQLAVLADPGCCAHRYGTRRDALIPSACLNSTISGLVSRAVLHSTLVGPHDFHGAKFYPHLALTKSAAITELARRSGARLVLAAGDSLLDIDMLRHADAAIHPAHGELAAIGWAHPTVTRTRTTGVTAGEEILHWLFSFL